MILAELVKLTIHLIEETSDLRELKNVKNQGIFNNGVHRETTELSLDPHRPRLFFLIILLLLFNPAHL